MEMEKVLTNAMEAYKAEDYKTALELFTQASEMGSARACFLLGLMYGWGIGVQENNVKRVELFEKACDLGCGEACYRLGFMYEWGMGNIEQNFSKASELYEKACNLGYKENDFSEETKRFLNI